MLKTQILPNHTVGLSAWPLPTLRLSDVAGPSLCGNMASSGPKDTAVIDSLPEAGAKGRPLSGKANSHTTLYSCHTGIAQCPRMANWRQRADTGPDPLHLAHSALVKS